MYNVDAIRDILCEGQYLNDAFYYRQHETIDSIIKNWSQSKEELFNWVCQHTEEVDQIIRRFLDIEHQTIVIVDFFKRVQEQYILDNSEHILYDNIQYVMYTWLMCECNIWQINNELKIFIDKLCSNIDTSKTVSYYIDKVLEKINELKYIELEKRRA